MAADRRSLLVMLNAALWAVGLVALLIPFGSYLGLSAAAGSTLPRLDIEALGLGEYAFFDNGWSGYWKGKYLVIRERDGTIHLVEVRTHEERFAIPDTHWWNYSGFCEKLEPDTVAGKIVLGGAIRCNDASLPPPLVMEWQWDYSGKSRGEWVADFHRPEFVVEGGDIVVGKSK